MAKGCSREPHPVPLVLGPSAPRLCTRGEVSTLPTALAAGGLGRTRMVTCRKGGQCHGAQRELRGMMTEG